MGTSGGQEKKAEKLNRTSGQALADQHRGSRPALAKGKADRQKHTKRKKSRC
jgi:hypothetical protein